MEGGTGGEAATIFALATAPGVSGIAVVRISGPEADAALTALTGRCLPEYRRAAVRVLRDAAGSPIDEALVLRFAAGASHTGEAMAEIQCHGGRAVVQAVLGRLSSLPGLRSAAPGEFTRRAFVNGRLDLTQVEALGDLLAAETEAQRRFAMAGVRGRLRREAEAWRASLLEALALVEVGIDWADEEVPADVTPEVAAILEGLQAALRRELRGAAATERLRLGFTVALVGAPNVGKSSLLNALAGREAALTSDVPGTTRDAIEVAFDLDGLPVTFVDTAGLRAASDAVERLGIERTLERAAGADVRVFLWCDGVPVPEAAQGLRQEGDLTVSTKADLGHAGGGLSVSSRTGEGLDAFLEALRAVLADRVAQAGLIGHTRQREAARTALASVEGALARLPAGAPELVAADLWEAARAIERLGGRLGAEDLLEAVFGRFCLGK